MGVKARPAAVEAIRQRVNQVSGHPAMGQVFKCLGAMATGAVLAGAAVGGVLLPLPLALAAALGLGLESFAAYAGGCLGYAVLWGLDAGLEPMAAGLLAEACLCIFGDQLSRDNRWFAPGAATPLYHSGGFLFLLEQRFAPAAVWRLALRAAAAGGGAVLFRRALEGAALPRLCLLAALVSGLSALAPGGFALGLPLGCLLSAGALGTPQSLPVGRALRHGAGAPGTGRAAVVLPLAAMVASTGQGFLVRTGLWLFERAGGGALNRRRSHAPHRRHFVRRSGAALLPGSGFSASWRRPRGWRAARWSWLPGSFPGWGSVWRSPATPRPIPTRPRSSTTPPNGYAAFAAALTSAGRNAWARRARCSTAPPRP